MIIKTKLWKEMLLKLICLFIIFFPLHNGLNITQYSKLRTGQVQVTVNGVDYGVCTPVNLIKLSVLGSLICMKLGLIGHDGWAGTVYTPVGQKILSINYACLNSCNPININTCFNENLEECPSHQQLFITCLSQSTTKPPQIDCPILSNVKVSLAAPNVVVFDDGVSEWMPSFLREHALLYSKMLCRVLGYAHYYSTIAVNVEYPYVIEMTNACATPCGKKKINDCLQFPSNYTRSDVWEILCFTEKKPINSSTIVDTCKLIEEMGKSASAILSDSQVIWHDVTVDDFTNGLTGYVALNTNENNLYRICVNSTSMQIGLFGPMLCTELGYEPSGDAFWVKDDAKDGVSSYMQLYRSCLNNCYGQKICFLQCLIKVDTCPYNQVLKVACGKNKVTPIKNGNFTCPLFENGLISQDLKSLIWTKNNEVWYMCTGVNDRAKLAKYACLQMGYSGALTYGDTYHYDPKRVAQLSSTCLPVTCANFTIEQCLTLPPLCPFNKAFYVTCYGTKGPALKIIDTCATTMRTTTIATYTTTLPGAITTEIPGTYTTTLSGAITTEIPGTYTTTLPGAITTTIASTFTTTLSGAITTEIPGTYTTKFPAITTEIPGTITTTIPSTYTTTLPGAIITTTATDEIGTTTTPYRGDGRGLTYIIVKGTISKNNVQIIWDDNFNNKQSDISQNATNQMCEIIIIASDTNDIDPIICLIISFARGSVIGTTELLASTKPRTEKDPIAMANKILQSINGLAATSPSFALQNVKVLATYAIDVAKIEVFARSGYVLKVSWVTSCPDCLLLYILQWRLSETSSIESSNAVSELSYNVTMMRIPETAQFRVRSMSRSYLSLYSLWTNLDNVIQIPETTTSKTIYITTSTKPPFPVGGIIAIVVILILLLILLIILIVLYKCHEGFRQCITCHCGPAVGGKKMDPSECSVISDDPKKSGSISEPHYSRDSVYGDLHE